MIYYGTFGRALFQTLYEAPSSIFAYLPFTLEWNLAAVALLGAAVATDTGVVLSRPAASRRCGRGGGHGMAGANRAAARSLGEPDAGRLLDLSRPAGAQLAALPLADRGA